MEINRIYNEDCIEGMKKIPSASIDMVLTDPPYTSPTVHAFGRQKVNRLSDLAIQEFYFAEIKKEWERILKPNAPVLIFCDDIYSAVLMGLFYEWQRHAGRMNGQSKFPRVMKEQQFTEWENFLKQYTALK